MGNHTIRQSALAFMVAVVGLACVPSQVLAGPLDGYGRAQVRQWLLDELEDLFLIFHADQSYDDQDIEDAVMDLLSDHPSKESAKHREAHRYLTQAALKAEMEEADTSLREVVHAAILEADALSLIQPSSPSVVTVAWKQELPADSDISGSGLLLAQKSLDGRGKPKDARVTVANGVTNAVFIR